MGRINYLDDSVDLTLYYADAAQPADPVRGGPRPSAWRNALERGIVDEG